MILTSSAPARAPRLRSTRRAAATLAAAALALVGFGTPAFAAPSPSPTPTGPELSGTVELTLAPVGEGIVRAGSGLTASATIANGTTTTIPATQVALELGDAPLADRAALSAWLSGSDSAALPEVASAAVDAVASGAESTSALVISPDDPVLAERAPGVYPLRARAVVGEDALVSTSAMIVPDDAQTAAVGLVVPITAPALTRGLLTADQLAELTATDGELTAQLDAVEGTPVILAIDPAIPAAIRVLGRSAPDTALAWLARLEALPHTRFALQFGDADLATQVHAGLPSPLTATSLVSYISVDDVTMTPTPTPDPTASPTASAQEDTPETALPDLAQLTDVGAGARDGMYWPATGTAGADVIATLGGLAVDGTPSMTLVSSADLTSADGPVTRARAAVGAAQVLAYDTGISAALAAAADEQGTAQRGAALTAATAHLAFAARDAAGQPLLVAVDRGTDRTRVSLRTAITAVTQAPGVAALGLPDVAAAEPIAAEIADVAADDARTAALTTMLAEENQIASFATVLEDPALLTGRERAEILQLLGVAWRAETERWTVAVADHHDRTRETLDAVGILPSSVVNLISYDAAFGPWIRNDLPWPAHVVLVAQPDDPRLIVEQRTDVVASAASNTRVTVPVQARVGSGTVTVTMQLYSPTGVPIGTVQSSEVEVRAEWETIGLGILITLMALFLGLGIFRTVRRRRRARAAAAHTPELEPDVRTDIETGEQR